MNMLPASNKIAVAVVCLASIMFLISGLKAGNETGRRSRKLSVLAGLVGLIWVALEFCSFFYGTLCDDPARLLSHSFSHDISGVGYWRDCFCVSSSRASLCWQDR